jgi:hypothetical protein
VLVPVLPNDHRHQVASGLFVQMILIGIRAIPRPERTAEHHTFPAGQKHLRGTHRETVVTGRVASLVCKADIADARAHISELPGPPAILVIGAGRELPCDSGRVFDAAFRLAVVLQEVAGRKGCLADDLRNNLVVEQPRLELAAEMRGVFIDLGFGFLDAEIT